MLEVPEVLEVLEVLKARKAHAPQTRGQDPNAIWSFLSESEWLFYKVFKYLKLYVDYKLCT